MQLIRRPSKPFAQPSIVAIGKFDGLHRGHQQLLSNLIKLAEQDHLVAGLLTFEPYPEAYLSSNNSVTRLSTLREKITALQSWPLNFLYVLPFTEKIARLSPKGFIDKILIQQLKVKKIIIGEDFRFGFQRQGQLADLKGYFGEENILTESSIEFQGQRISSGWIRQALASGQLKLVRQLLGQPYELRGRVVKGAQRGRSLGFPTANLALHKRQLPLKGVFAVKVKHKENNFNGVANLGVRPTVDGQTAFLEIYIFDFNCDIYGEFIEVKFIQKIRDEQRFASLEALKAKIAEDVAQAQEILKNELDL